VTGTIFHPAAAVSEWMMITVLVFLFTLAVSWIGFLVMFPLTFASATFVPTETMPPVLRAFAENQPTGHPRRGSRPCPDVRPAGGESPVVGLGVVFGHYPYFHPCRCLFIQKAWRKVKVAKLY